MSVVVSSAATYRAPLRYCFPWSYLASTFTATIPTRVATTPITALHVTQNTPQLRLSPSLASPPTAQHPRHTITISHQTPAAPHSSHNTSTPHNTPSNQATPRDTRETPKPTNKLSQKKSQLFFSSTTGVQTIVQHFLCFPHTLLCVCV